MSAPEPNLGAEYQAGLRASIVRPQTPGSGAGHGMQRDTDAPRPRSSSRVWWLLVLVLVAGRIAVVPVTLDQAAVQGPRKVLTGDVRRFHAIATHPGTPYKTFEVEYLSLIHI